MPHAKLELLPTHRFQRSTSIPRLTLFLLALTLATFQPTNPQLSVLVAWKAQAGGWLIRPKCFRSWPWVPSIDGVL